MRVGLLAASFVVSASLASPGSSRAPRPQLSLRATPRVALSPSGVVFMAELRGGHDSEDFHCPALEWDWDDGTRSANEGDCEPFKPETVIERRFTARHLYRGPGDYKPRLTLSRGGRSIAAATVTITVRGFGYPD